MPVQLVSIMGGGLAGQSATFLRGFLGKIFGELLGIFRCTIWTTHMKAFENLYCGEISLIIIILKTIVIIMLTKIIVILVIVMIISIIVMIIMMLIMIITK